VLVGEFMFFSYSIRVYCFFKFNKNNDAKFRALFFCVFSVNVSRYVFVDSRIRDCSFYRFQFEGI
jgi:hypothetical protein